MDIIFNCPKCEQELAVDNAGAGSEINCPSCGEKIVIPPPAPTPLAPMSDHHDAAQPLNPMASSAAAKVEMHLKVPVHNKPAESLIAKPLKPLDAVAKESVKGVRVRTIRHTDCVEVGHDKFDEIVSGILAKIGESNIISVNTLTYQHLDIGSQKIMTDFGVMIVYRT